MVADDHPGLLQKTDTAVARGQTQTHAIRKVSNRLTAVTLQLRKNLPISSVHE